MQLLLVLTVCHLNLNEKLVFQDKSQPKRQAEGNNACFSDTKPKKVSVHNTELECLMYWLCQRQQHILAHRSRSVCRKNPPPPQTTTWSRCKLKLILGGEGTLLGVGLHFCFFHTSVFSLRPISHIGVTNLLVLTKTRRGLSRDQIQTEQMTHNLMGPYNLETKFLVSFVKRRGALKLTIAHSLSSPQR